MSLAGFRELVRVANLALEHMEEPGHLREALCRKCLAADELYKALHAVVFGNEREYPIAIKDKARTQKGTP